MELKILAVYENLDGYILEMEKEPADYEGLWNKYAIQPYWDKISKWAPFDMSDRKPKPIKDICKLKQQIKLMKELDLNVIKDKFINVIDALPNYSDDTIVTAIYPLDDKNTTIKERQNGVIGSCVFGNIIISINPLGEDYLDWIPYVFAHEYHHCVWGSYWYGVKGVGGTGSLIEAMLTDGQADKFAKSLYPALNPTWISQIPKELEKELWVKYYSKILNETDYDYGKYMFGNDKEGIPWCTGYFFGYKIIDCFRKRFPQIGFKNIIEMRSEEIFVKSCCGLMQIDEKIYLSEYSNDWTEQFKIEKSIISNRLPNIPIEHIGSTSVIGMTAKPIIDIMVGVDVYPPLQEIIETIEQLGYFNFGENDKVNGRLYFAKRGTYNFNLHVIRYLDVLWKNNILFREYLRTHNESVIAYSTKKKEIVGRGVDRLLQYSKEKSDFITSIINQLNQS